MSWDDVMRRILPPIGSVQPQITGPAGMFGAGEAEGRKPPSRIPHPGADFDYIGGQTSRLNLSHPALRSPIDGVVENAGEGSMGRIAMRDKDGYPHEILHTDARHVRKGDPVVAGQIIGTMGNTGVRDQHVHYQLRDRAGKVIDPVAFWDQRGQVDPDPDSPSFLDQSRRAAEILSGLEETSPLNRALLPDRSGSPFYNPFNQTTAAPAVVAPPAVLNSQNPFADRYAKWGAVPFPNAPAASDNPASFNDRYGNWASSPANGLGDIPASRVLDQGKRTEADDHAPVRVLSRVNLSSTPASASPLLGIFSGKPMPDYPVWPAIFDTDDRSSPDGDELYQRWRQWLDA